ncbi:hypothetical protein H6G47_06890, partial [Aphanizomenon flos-aquae FACHB-1416]|nr:hypothetical protein [Aphanizomenon flos-aquae FACHB-1416]
KLYATNQFIPKKWSGEDPARDAIDKGIAKVGVILGLIFFNVSRRILSKMQVTNS